MRSRSKLCAIALATLLARAGVAAGDETVAPAQGLRDKTPAVHAFTHARIVTAPGSVIENGGLVIRDGRIVAVGADIAVPADAVLHDVEGKTIYPGFVDPYTEYGLAHVEELNSKKESDGPKYEGDRAGADSWNDAVHAERVWVGAFRPDEEAASALRKQGFTSVHSAKMDGVFRGRGMVAGLGKGPANTTLRRADGLQLLSFDKGSSQQSYPSSLMGSIALLRQTFLDADWYRGAHAADPTATETNRALAALAGYDGPFLFETSDELEVLRAARIAAETGRSLVLVGSNREYQRIEEIAATRAAFVLPLTFPEKPEVGSLEEELDVTLADLRHWERAPSNPAVLAQRGVRFAFTGHGLEKDDTVLGQVRKAVKLGLPADTALAALTTVPASLLGVLEESGTLARGKRADFLVADGDLLAGKAEILAVWVDGREAESIEPIDDEGSVAGTYRLDLEGVPYTLTLTEVEGELKGTLRTGETTHELEKIVADFGRYSFRAPFDPSGGEGLTRFTIRRLADRVSGQAVLPDGRLVSFPLVPDDEAAGPKKEGELPPHDYVGEQEEEPETLVSRVTYPNLPFGFEQPPASEDVLVRNATIWTAGPEGALENADLLVRNGKIVAVGAGLEGGAARVIDGAGLHVTPGMIDEHSHLAISRGVNEGSHAVTAEVRIGDVVDPDDVGIYRALAGGTTTAQLLHGSANPIGGQAQVVKLRWGAAPEAMKVADAPPSIKFALGENVKQSNWGSEFRTRYPQTRMGVETIMRDAFLAAHEYDAAWKTHQAAGSRRGRREAGGAGPPRRDLQLEALAEILNGERFVHSHSYVQSEILMLMRLAEELGFRIQTFTHILEGYKVAPEMARHGAGASTFSDWWAYKFEVYDAIPHNTCLMHEAGVVTSINSDDSEVIRRLNQEAAKSVMYCGMSEEDALKLATLNPARQLRLDHRIGSLEPGKDADFVIWNGHPLSIHSRAEQTWVDGTLYFSRDRDTELRRRDQAEKQALIQKAIAKPAKDEEDEEDEEDETPEEETPENQGPEWHCDDTEDVWHAYAD